MCRLKSLKPFFPIPKRNVVDESSFLTYFLQKTQNDEKLNKNKLKLVCSWQIVLVFRNIILGRKLPP